LATPVQRGSVTSVAAVVATASRKTRVSAITSRREAYPPRPRAPIVLGAWRADLEALHVNATSMRFHRQLDLEEVYVLSFVAFGTAGTTLSLPLTPIPRHAVVGDAQKGTAPRLEKI
jgi:hypothetical protein